MTEPIHDTESEAVSDPSSATAPEAMTGEIAPDQGQGDAEASAPDQVEALTRALSDQNDKYLRLYAEFENFRKRSVRERQEAEHRGMGNLIRGLLEMIDDLARFAHVDPATVDSRTVVEGAQMVEKKLLKSLAGHGLELIDPAGQSFDPALHEAITTTPAASEAEDHMVAQVFQVGYRFNGLLLRPARVVVTQWNG